jgi:hypothetical protein
MYPAHHNGVNLGLSRGIGAAWVSPGSRFKSGSSLSTPACSRSTSNIQHPTSNIQHSITSIRAIIGRASSLIMLLLLAAASSLSAQPTGPGASQAQPRLVLRGITNDPGNGRVLLQPQMAAQPPRDPFMSLMLSQPNIEIPEVPSASAAFDPPVVRRGELSFLRVVFNALEVSVEWPTNLAAPPQLEMRPGAHGQLLQMTTTSMEPRTAFNYRVRASSLGSFTVPEFVVKVDGKTVTVPSARLEVVAAPPPSVPRAEQLTLELPLTNLFVGQPVTARILLPGSPASAVQGLGQPQISGQGILVDVGGARQRYDMAPRGGAMFATFIYETTLTPVMAGKLTVFAQGFTAGSRFSGPVVVTGPATMPGGLRYPLLESEPVELNVQPLPREGLLPGFTGAIGSLAVGLPKLATNVLRVGDPVKLTVIITNRGEGPLARLVAPPPPQAEDWEVFAAGDFAPTQPIAPPRPFVRLGPDGKPVLTSAAQPVDLQGVVAFNYTLIPLTEAARATPPIPFSYFDPKAGAYVDLTIASVPVTIKTGAVPGDLSSFLQAGAADGEPEKELVLSSLAGSRGRTASSLVPPQQQPWFPLVQLAPAVAFFGVWSWDRRRRYLETHTDIVLRRRARRALRRQRRVLQRAARVADAPRFATAAVNAMRAACAPHYPAEPRALVGSDVLPLLSEPERSGQGGQVVRRFFSVTDAALFGPASSNVADLLPLKPDLERVLQDLEQKL